MLPWLQRFGRALFVLPYISVVSEKAAHLTDILKPIKCRIKGYTGSHQGTPLTPM